MRDARKATRGPPGNRQRTTRQPTEVEITAFGHRFRLYQGLAQDLITLEREGAVYSHFFDEGLGTFRLYRIPLLPDEVFRYVEAHVAKQRFDNAERRGASFEEALTALYDDEMAERVRSYGNYGRTKLKDGTTADIRGCAASFYPPEIEALVCGQRKERYQLMPRLEQTDTPSLVIRIFDSLPVTAKSLLHRGHGRAPFTVECEYDLQDLLFAVMRSILDDVRAEEWTPQHAGKSRRIDLVVPSAGLVVEVKYVRDPRHAKRIVDELMVDIESYHTHPNCERLLMFVWDPAGYVGDPLPISRDLSGLRVKGADRFEVQVLIRP